MMDANRAEDGIDLRYLFGDTNGHDPRLIAAYLDNHPSSVLEVMVALVRRCEVDIMSDPDIGDRTSDWFWAMISNLGLQHMNNNNYDEKSTNYKIQRFLDRNYRSDGKGGLFAIKNCEKDLREVEIWYQMCLYLDDIIRTGGDYYA